MGDEYAQIDVQMCGIVHFDEVGLEIMFKLMGRARDDLADEKKCERDGGTGDRVSSEGVGAEQGDVCVAEHEGDDIVLEADHVGGARVEGVADDSGDDLRDVHDAGGHGDVRVSEHEGDDPVHGAGGGCGGVL